METQQVVIVGAGHAGAQCAMALRQEGFDGRIVLIGGEGVYPYQRPPLSKAYLLAQAAEADLAFRPAPFYEERRIQLLHAQAEHIDRPRRQVVLQSGETVPYDHLVIATGGHPRQLSVPGADLDGVAVLQTLEHATALRGRLQPGRRAVVVGAGFIGLEFAAVARKLGLDVTVVDVADRALARAASAEIARTLVEAQVQRGVQFQFGCGVQAIEGADGRVHGVRTHDGRLLPADVVLAGIGVQPRMALAVQAGLDVGNGIRVDEALRTSDAVISAIGDVAEFPDPRSGTRVRLESVQNATHQARLVAARLAGKRGPVDAVPWFWSDQGELKLQIAGLGVSGDEEVLLAGATPQGRTVLRVRDGLLSAVETINRPADHMLARRLLAKPVRVDPAQAQDPAFQLAALG